MEEKDKTVKIEIEPLQENNSINLITINGYIDSYSAQYFQNTLLNLIASGNKNLLINASGLSYISSAGIGAFMAITKKLDDSSGNLVIYSMQSKVLEIFNLLGFTSFFKIVDTKERALTEYFNIQGQGKETPLERIIEQVIFPLTFKCPACGKRLKSPKAGKYRCVSCKNIIVIDNNGNVTAG